MKLSAVRSMARRNTLEVEHLLKAAKARTPGLRQELQQLSQELQWSATRHPRPGVHVVPLAKWAELAGCYAEHGFAGLAPLAGHRQDAGYVLALIEEVGNADAVHALLDFFQDVIADPAGDMEIAHAVAATCNRLFSFRHSPVVTDGQAQRLRDFLVSFCGHAEDQVHKAMAVYALRGVGDAQSIDFIGRQPRFQPPHEDAGKIAIKAIKKRLGSRQSFPLPA